MRHIATLVTVIALVLVSRVHAADAPATLMAEPGKAIFASDFTKELDAAWKAAKGKWEIVDGAMRGIELKEQMHGAVTRHPLAAADMVISYEFKIDGSKGTTLSLNDAKGHNSRVSINDKSMTVRKDDHDHDGPDKAVLLQTLKVDIKEGQWHTLVVEVVGPEIVATLDGKHVALGSHEAIAAKKVNVGVTVAGESVSFRNFKVWEATQKKDWAATKANRSQKAN